MMDSKSIFTSKTFLGLIVAVGAPLLAKHGIVLTDGIMVDAVSLVGAAFAVWGRFRAQQRVHVLPR